jgi:hypothetical protein
MTHTDQHTPAPFRITPGDLFRPTSGGQIHRAKLDPIQRRAEGEQTCVATCGRAVRGHLVRLEADAEGERCPLCFPGEAL